MPKLVVDKGIKSRLALTSRQMKERKEDLVQVITDRESKVDEAIQVGWKMKEAEEN